MVPNMTHLLLKQHSNFNSVHRVIYMIAIQYSYVAPAVHINQKQQAKSTETL